MKIASLDLSSRTGFALWDTSLPRSEIHTEILPIRQTEPGDYLANASISWPIVKICREVTVDFWVIEAPIGVADKHINAFAQQRELLGAVGGILYTRMQAWGVIAVQTWRSTIYGRGFKLPMIQKERFGKPCFNSDGSPELVKMDWKQKAVFEAKQLGVTLPNDDHNCAEAALMALCWYKSAPQGNRSQAAMLKLMQDFRQKG